MSTDEYGRKTVRVEAPVSMHMFEYQAPATLNQANPVNGTWYDILPATDNVRVYMIGVNVEDDNETLEVQAFVDGETIQAAGFAATHSTDYFVRPGIDAVNRFDYMLIAATAYHNYGSFVSMEGHSVQVQVRKTTAAGAGNLTGIVCYGVLRRAT